ncbi:MAG: Uncharacterised protein [SAR116 cluster bacterium]|nr:MAG: Uncharacterised protein [SAR116 cluster bacterium]
MRSILGIASACRNDFALFQKRIAHRNGLGQQSARVVAQIENNPLQRISFCLEEVIHCFHEARRGLFGKCGDTDITDAIEQFRPHRADFDEIANDGDIKRLCLTALDLDLYL